MPLWVRSDQKLAAIVCSGESERCHTRPGNSCGQTETRFMIDGDVARVKICRMYEGETLGMIQ